MVLTNGFAEEKSGYGHVSAENLAEALSETFDIQLKESHMPYVGERSIS